MSNFLGQEKIIVIADWNYRGPHVSSNTYAAGDAVGVSGALYVAIQSVPANTAITNTSYWVNGLKGDRGPIGYPPLIQFTNDGSTYYNPPATSLTIGYRYSLDNGNTWSNFIRTKGNTGTKGDKGDPAIDGADGRDAPLVLIQYADRAESTDFGNEQQDSSRYIRFSSDNGISWTNALKFIGKDGRDGLDVEIQYSVDGATNWHPVETDQDVYERARIGDEDPFGPARRIRGTGSGWAILATAPTHPIEGDGWYDTDNNELKIYDGSSWGNVGITSAQSTKLAGIETGAQVNPKRHIRFSAEDADAGTNGVDIQNSEIGFYTGANQVQSGDITAADTIYLPVNAATYGQDVSSPGTNLTAQNTTSLLNDIVDNGGVAFLYIIPNDSLTTNLYVEAATITRVISSGTLKGYKLTNLHWYGSYTPVSQGVSWNIVVDRDSLTFVKNIVDFGTATSVFVKKTDLEGHEVDRYASYTNAFIAQGAYKVGSICLFNQSSGPLQMPMLFVSLILLIVPLMVS